MFPDFEFMKRPYDFPGQVFLYGIYLINLVSLRNNLKPYTEFEKEEMSKAIDNIIKILNLQNGSEKK